jgi:hypothetical protein
MKMDAIADAVVYAAAYLSIATCDNDREKGVRGEGGQEKGVRHGHMTEHSPEECG